MYIHTCRHTTMTSCPIIGKEVGETVFLLNEYSNMLKPVQNVLFLLLVTLCVLTIILCVSRAYMSSVSCAPWPQ